MLAVKEYLTELLKNDLKAKGLCVWLDVNSEYSTFINEVMESETFPYPLLTFKGSFLEMMLELSPYFQEKDNKPCLIHMPGFNQKSIKETPLLEAYKAGKELQYNLKTLVRNATAGKLASEQLNFLLEDENFSLELADSRLTEEDQTPEGLKRLISKHSSVEIAVDLLKEKREFDELIELPPNQWLEAFIKFFHLQFGITKEWFAYWQEEISSDDPLITLQIPLAAHLMCTEYTWDLKAEPKHEQLAKLKNISEIQHKNCCRVTKELRERHSDLYRSLAKEIEPQLETEKQQLPENFGEVDTFAFEEEKILSLAFKVLENKEWHKVLDLYKQRLGTKKGKEWESFWVQSDNSKRWIWKWMELSTRLAQWLERGLQTIEGWTAGRLSPVQITNQYTGQLYQIDQIHREFEQWTSHLKTLTSLPNFSQITTLTRLRREQYREYINKLTTLFNQSCKQHGFLPPEEFRQRTFHKQIVEPLLAEDATVVFYIDAFRYELGEELARLLREDKGEVKLSARLAELPTVTSVGMNALLPLDKSGYLTPGFDKQRGKFVGFRSSEKLIDGPTQREKLLKEQSGLPFAWVALKEMSDKSPDDLKRQLKGKQFVVVHSLEIDELGETGLLSIIPDYFEKTISRLLTVVNKLQQAGFQQFIFTADHGFIQADETVKGERIPYVDVETRRYILHSTQLESSLVTAASLAELNYQVEEPSWLLISPTADLFQKPGDRDRFYHGGNSLQERIIPVITYKKKRPPRLADEEDFKIKIEIKTGVMGLHRIVLKAEHSGRINMFGQQQIILQLDTPAEYKASVLIAEVNPGIKIGNQIDIPVEKEIEIFFKLQGETAGKAPLKISRPQRTDGITEIITTEFFEVIGEAPREEIATPISNITPAQAIKGNETFKTNKWPAEIPEEFHPVLNHLENHEFITEIALTNMLGGAGIGSRKARKFAANIQGWLIQLPFNIEIMETSEGKTYRKLI